MMKILVLNCGSSSLKFRVIKLESDGSFCNLSRGTVTRIGGGAEFNFAGEDGASRVGNTPVENHRQAVMLALNWITTGECSLHEGLLVHDFDAVGHRVVHGGDLFPGPVLLDDQKISDIDGLRELAPLHNPVAAEGMRAAKSFLGESVPMAAVFDTGYSESIPEYASIYAIPYELTQKYKIRRYGPHGIAHRYMALRFSEITGIALEKSKLITMQLGNGASVTAVKGGRHIDTSMGFTPLEGLVMGTRTGDLDPAVLFYLARKEGLGIEDLDELANFKSGLLGVSGISNDMGKILEIAEKGADKRAKLAVDVFCYRVAKYIGAYLSVLEGADAIIFGGGIGENAVSIRDRICGALHWCGLRYDPARNSSARGCEAEISSDGSAIRAFVIPVDEEVLIARETERLCNFH